MAKTITINGVDQTSIVRLEGQVWAEAAYLGEVASGGFDFSDEGGTRTVPAMKAITVAESASSPTRLFTGYILDRTLARGQYALDSDRAHDVSTVDLNTLLDDRLLTAADTAERPEETDFARVSWLLGTAAMTGISAGVVPNTNTVTMDATDYRGANPRRVLDECSEFSGKNYYVYHDAGTLLWYDQVQSTSRSSALRLSTVEADVDSTTTFHMSKDETSLTLSPVRVYSTLRFVYANGEVTVTNGATETAFRRREYTVTDNTVKTAAKATAKANRWLAAAAAEAQTFSSSVHVPAAKVNDILAGQRIEVKAPHLDIDSFTWKRISRREVMPFQGASQAVYTIRLEFTDPLKATRFSGSLPPTNSPGTGTGEPADGTPGEEEPDCCDDVEAMAEGVGLSPAGETVTAYDAGVIREHSFTDNNGNIQFVDLVTFPGAAFVTDGIWPNITHPNTNCGIGLGGWGPGYLIEEAWYKIDYSGLPAGAISGRFKFFAGDTDTGTAGTGGQASITNRRIIGVAYAAPTKARDFIPIGAGPITSDLYIDLPRSQFPASGDLYLIEAASWEAERDTFFCDGELAQAGTFTGGYGPSGSSGGEGNSGHYLPFGVERAWVSHTTGTGGYSNWVSGTGLVNGVNKVYTLPDWDGLGTPEVRIGGIIAGAGHYTWDGATKTVTLKDAYPTGADIRFRYRVAV